MNPGPGQIFKTRRSLASTADEYRIKLAQKRDAIRSHSHYCWENQHQETKNITFETNYFLGRKRITQQYRDSNVKPHRAKTIAKRILHEPPKRGVHSNTYWSREQNYDKGNRNQTTYKGIVQGCEPFLTLSKFALWLTVTYWNSQVGSELIKFTTNSANRLSTVLWNAL